MLYLSSRLYNLPLLSIRSGGKIGVATEPIINPHNLHIDGFYCQLVNAANDKILLDMLVRDISAKGVIINDHQDLSDASELVRLQPIIDIQYQLIGKQVIANKKRLGKVIEFAIDIQSLFVQKLYVQPPVWQSLSQQRLTFDRASIIEITDKAIIVHGPEAPARSQKKQTTSNQLVGDYSASASLTKE